MTCWAQGQNWPQCLDPEGQAALYLGDLDELVEIGLRFLFADDLEGANHGAVIRDVIGVKGGRFIC